MRLNASRSERTSVGGSEANASRFAAAEDCVLRGLGYVLERMGMVWVGTAVVRMLVLVGAVVMGVL